MLYLELRKTTLYSRKNDNLIIQKSDKGNSIVIIAKDDCLQKIRNILSDSGKFS